MNSQSDINRLIVACEELYEYSCEFGNITGETPLFKTFKELVQKFDYKYTNQFMVNDYGPKFVLRSFFRAKYWTPSAVKTIIVVLKQIEKEYFYSGREEDSELRKLGLIHPIILKVSNKKFLDEHYADSVESAMKEVNSRVKAIFKKQTGSEKDGVDLMRQAFLTKNPALYFDDTTTESGKNVQEGYSQIFVGAIQGIRNPKAHANLEISKSEAIKQLVLASFLMDKIDEALIFTGIRE